MRLPRLKSLSLRISTGDSDLPYHRIKKDLYFVSLRNIKVDCGNFEGDAKFVDFLLSRSPLLKEFSLHVFPQNLAFYRIIFDKFPLYDQMEIFRLVSRAPDEVQSFICNELSKM
uniref:FBD domain-containing protein n=1 Tax=Romanomermis culicivorax TaxID=13658 RepID=A0A915IZ19_ROMCU